MGCREYGLGWGRLGNVGEGWEGCGECVGRLGRVAVSLGEGWGGLQGVRRKDGQGCSKYGGRLDTMDRVAGSAEEGWAGLQ